MRTEKLTKYLCHGRDKTLYEDKLNCIKLLPFYPNSSVSSASSGAVLCCCGLAFVSTLLTSVALGQSLKRKVAHLQVVVV